MDLGLTDRLVVVTGASGGLGGVLVRTLRAEGARVAAQGFTAAASLADEFADDHGTSVIRADLSDAASVDAMFRQAEAWGGPVDAVVAAAGRWPQPRRRIDETPPDELDQALTDNLRSAVWTARGLFGALGRSGPRSGGASLVLVGSTAGRFGEAGHVAYAASKAGLRGLCLTLKNEIVELDPAGRVNLVEPGWIATERVRGALAAPGAVERATRTMPLRRVAAPEDVARVIVGLLSPVMSRHLTGTIVPIAGGMEGRVLW